MSLLDELHSIDLSGIVSARGSISASVAAPDLQAVVSGGAAQTAMAGLGASLTSFRSDFSDPAALLHPLVDAVGGLKGHFSLDGVPIDRYLSSVSEGVTIAVSLVEGLDRDPLAIGRVFGSSLGDRLGSLTNLMGSFTQIGGPDLGRLRSQIENVDRGLPSGADDLAHLALDLLLPIPRQNLLDIRGGLDSVFSASRAITLPAGRTSGLLAALDAITAAADARDAAALNAALRNLGQVRDNTVQVVEADLLGVFEKVGRIRMDQFLTPMVAASSGIRFARDGVIEILDTMREELISVRAQVESLDPQEMLDLLNRFLDTLEQLALDHIVKPIEAQIDRIKDFIRGLLGKLPIRAIRSEITRFLHSIAQAIEDAGIDRVANAVHDALAQIRSVLSGANLAADVQQAVQKAAQAITAALDPVIQAVESIGQQINAVAGEAQQILDRAAGAVDSFADAMTSITADIEALDVEAAGDQVVQTLAALKDKAEKLLSVAPLPEPMRPLVEQLISTLENVDFDVVFRPVRSAADQIKVPDDVLASVTEALSGLDDALQNLIPQQLIASVEAEINSALDVIRDFDPGSLVSGVTGYLDEAASFLEGLDPRPAVGQIRAPFQAVLDAVDTVQPRRVLRPVIEAYDSVMSKIQLPAVDLAAQRLGETINTSGESIGGAITGPMQSLLNQPGTSAPSSSGGGAAGGSGGGTPSPASGGAPPGTGTDLPTFHPGDVIRIFGYVPGKLREALQAMEAGPAGDFLRTVDGLTGGLARDIRLLQAELRAVETRVVEALNVSLSPVGSAQVRAQLHIQANFGTPGSGVDVAASMAIVAQASPSAIRHELARTLDTVLGRVRSTAAGAGGSAGAVLERAATALESFRLSGLAGDADALLAALDPEPLAQAVDDLVAAALRRAPDLLNVIEAGMSAAVRRVQDLIAEFNPAAQAHKFLDVLDVLREEINLLNPAVLADELGEIHAAIRKTIAAYDPAVFAADIFATLQEIAQSLRSLDPATLLGDLSFLDNILDRVEAAVPTKALAGVGESLTDVGKHLEELDPAGLLEAIEGLGPRVVDEFEAAVKKIRDEVVALLETIKYANANASGSVSVSLGVA